MNDERLENFLWSITSSFSKVFPPKKPKHQKTFGTFFWHFYILSKVVCKNFYSISLILIKVYSQTPDVTANAKDSEVRYKKVYGFWFIHLKNWNMSHYRNSLNANVLIGEKWKNISNKKVSSVNVLKNSLQIIQKNK